MMDRLATALANLAATMARFDELRVRRALASEAIVLPRWPKRAHGVQKTRYMRRNMGISEVDLLRRMLDLPDARTALRQYRETHQRTLQPKRAKADPDVLDASWRQRTPRYLSAEDLIREQLSGKAMAKELRRL